MTLNITLFRDLIPEFSGTSDATLNRIAIESSRFISSTSWGAKADIALVYYTAHLLKISTSGGAAGGVTREKVGDVERSYGSVKNSGDGLDSTSYGRTYKTLRSSLVISPFLVC